MIETERLILSEYTLQDFDAIYEILSDSEQCSSTPSLVMKNVR